MRVQFLKANHTEDRNKNITRRRGKKAGQTQSIRTHTRTHACYSQGSQHAAQIYTLAWTRDGCERMGKNDDDGGQQKRNQTHHQPTGDIVKSTMMSGLKLNAWQRCGRRFRAVHSCALPAASDVILSLFVPKQWLMCTQCMCSDSLFFFFWFSCPYTFACVNSCGSMR